MEKLRRSAAIDNALLDDLIARLKGEGRLIERNQRLALPEHRAAFADEDAKLLDALECLFRENGFSPPSSEEIVQRLGADPKKVEKTLGILCDHERLVRVGDGLLFHREAVDRAGEILTAHLHKEGRLESVQFKYLLDTTRKFAIPLLDYFDRIGVTRRVGNTRYPRNQPGR